MVTTRFTFGCVTVVVLLAGCASWSTTTAQEVDKKVATATLACSTASGSGDDRNDKPAEDYIVVSPLELVSIKRYARYPRRHFEPRQGHDYSAKVPLAIVSGGGRVRLAIAPRWRGHAALFYAESTRGASRVEGGHSVLDFEACADAGRTFWSGGFKVDGPRCVRLRVRVNNADARTLRIAFGKGMCKSRKRVAS